ncbi:MAG: HEAT repeat domain-containing protein [Sedimentisphaerales bacterium]|nr:HEAT repeat domain-containing protein [Sedimentisphaerales bacterium]
MKAIETYRCTMSLLVLLLGASLVSAYPVGPALSLEKLIVEADVIFKGTAASSQPVQDDWFKPYSGFLARETRFKVLSIVKGEGPNSELAFRHYDMDPAPLQGYSFMPQYYHFEPGKSYIVFAKKTETAGVLRQLWANHKAKRDQGVVQCPDDRPLELAPIKQVLWTELTAMLKSSTASDVTYAVGQLDQMSGGLRLFNALSDFDREDVLEALGGLIDSDEPKIARAVLPVIGSHNPYLSDSETLHWLATVGAAEVPGIGKRDPEIGNLGGQLYVRHLVTLADSDGSAETRAMAIRALGLVRESGLLASIERWLADPAPAVRAAGTLLLADFPSPQMRQRLTTLAGDPAPQVRACMARAAGFAQPVELADVLATLLVDTDRKVREAAAMSLLSFSPKDEAIAKVFTANLDNDEFKPLFLIALARENPAGYLDALATAVEQKTEPKNFWGGQIPALTAWQILFRYLHTQPIGRIRSGELDRYLDALEQVGNYSSSQPRDVYAFYVLCGMMERANRYRQKAKETLSYDIDYYFKKVDKNPSLYGQQ